MIEVTTKSGREMMLYHYEQWQMSNATHLWDVYDKFSRNKVRAMDYCEELVYKFHGRDLRILSHNSYTFTVGFEFPHPETGVLCFAYITPSYNRYIEL